MDVIVLVGSSGTGKSFHAINLAKQKDVKYIIDDGLLIKGNKVLGGLSAKRENTTIAAVKRAIFFHSSHRDKIKNIINKEKPNKILILGTSKNMVSKIVETLELGEITEWVFIEDIASKEDIDIARRYRVKEGKHIIPVPTFEIKKNFSGYFLNPLNIFRNFGKEEEDRSVVRPTFSYMGKYFISNGVIRDLVYYTANKIIGIYKVSNINIISKSHGIVIEMDVQIVYGNPIRPVIRVLQNQVKQEIEDMTAFNILAINVQVKNLAVL